MLERCASPDAVARPTSRPTRCPPPSPTLLPSRSFLFQCFSFSQFSLLPKFGVDTTNGKPKRNVSRRSNSPHDYPCKLKLQRRVGRACLHGTVRILPLVSRLIFYLSSSVDFSTLLLSLFRVRLRHPTHSAALSLSLFFFFDPLPGRGRLFYSFLDAATHFFLFFTFSPLPPLFLFLSLSFLYARSTLSLLLLA